MFYAVSKSLWFFLQPSSIIVLMLLAGLVLASRERWRRAGLRLAFAGLALLLVCGLSPLANLVILPLEERFPARHGRLPDGPVAGIILLGGYEDGRVTAGRGTLAVNEAADRLTEAALLAHRLPEARIVVSGGAGQVIRAEQAGADDVARWLAGVGIAKARIVVEGQSLTTHENALLTRALVTPKPGERWLLVTSAAHMPRSVGAFRRQGFDVIAWPADFRTRDGGDALRPFPGIPQGLRRLDDAVTEWIGLVAYRALGRTDALFPGP